MAVQRRFPDVQVTVRALEKSDWPANFSDSYPPPHAPPLLAQIQIGPWIDNGFYYDFYNPADSKFSEADLKLIKKEMDSIIKKKLPLVCNLVIVTITHASISHPTCGPIVMLLAPRGSLKGGSPQSNRSDQRAL